MVRRDSGLSALNTYLIIFRFKKSLNFTSYQTFLELLAKKKNMNLSEMKYKMVTCGPPPTYKTTVSQATLFNTNILLQNST